MNKTLLSVFLALAFTSCNSTQNSDAQLELDSLTDSTTASNGENLGSAGDYQPYGKAKADELAASRKNEIEAILEARGIPAPQVKTYSQTLHKALSFNEWDVVEEGEYTQIANSPEGNITLTSLLFGPFDGNGRGYSVLAIANNKLYLSSDHWENSGIDSAYNIQMANDKKVSFVEGNLQINSPSKGNLVLKAIKLD
jgi:hypothetical protein